MSASRFLPNPPAPGQDLNIPPSGARAGLTSVTRRSFLKRTGGATVSTLVAWNMATRESGARIVEPGASLSQFRMRITDCLPKLEDAPTSPEGFFRSNKVTWVNDECYCYFWEEGEQYGVKLETTITWETDPKRDFSELENLLEVHVEVGVIVELFKYKLGKSQERSILFSSERDGRWGGKRVAVIYCDRWNGNLLSADLPFWQRTRQFVLGGVNHHLASELSTRISKNPSGRLTVEFSPQATFGRVTSPSGEISAPELFDEQRSFATAWESYQIESE